MERRLELRSAAGEVDVLDPQEEAAAEPAGEVLVQEGRIGVAEMEPAVGARGEAENRLQSRGGIVGDGRPDR